VPVLHANGIEICCETTGDPGGEAVVLVHGYGSQLIQWPMRLREELAARGFHVIAIDNRDVGLSSKLEGQTYTLRDMAADVIGVLDALGIERAHLVGASLGGTIVQRATLDFPERVRTLTSIMSSTGSPALPSATPEAAAAIFGPTPTDREEYLDHLVRITKVFYGSHHDAEKVRQGAAARYDRSFYPPGMPRQLAALVSDGDRTEQLALIRCPTLVIHGRMDTLVPPANGEATAAAIPGAQLALFDDMGHDLPDELCTAYADLIAGLAAGA
jgi:pimeloyl-ACP methyl ester carboxylesterase